MRLMFDLGIVDICRTKGLCKLVIAVRIGASKKGQKAAFADVRRYHTEDIVLICRTLSA